MTKRTKEEKIHDAIFKFHSEGGFGGVASWGNPFDNIAIAEGSRDEDIHNLNEHFKLVIVAIHDFEMRLNRVMKNYNIDPDDF